MGRTAVRQGQRPYRGDVPTVLQSLSSEEFDPIPLAEADRRAIVSLEESAPAVARSHGLDVRAYAGSQMGTAAALRAINAEHGGQWYDVPPEAEEDGEAAAEAFRGDGPVVDVQTHYISDRPEVAPLRGAMSMMIGAMAGEWAGLDHVTQYSLAEYMRCIFLESDTGVAVLTSAPGQDGQGRLLTNPELAGTRALIERLGGTGRLLNHVVVDPKSDDDLEAMASWATDLGPVGWKTYTMGVVDPATGAFQEGTGWRLDDEDTGHRFLERVREVGPRLVCAHKGISGFVPTASPVDVGPAAAAFRDIDFLIYHSGFEPPMVPGTEEGAYSEESAELGVNRLITSLRTAGIGPGGNVHAEIGATWFLLIKRPEEAAHVLGKLLVALGPDNVVWGTDCAWWGPTQPLVDAFRAFEIPEWMQQKFGYPALTREIKEKVLSGNATRLYGIDLAAVRRAQETDDLAWVKATISEYEQTGTPSS